MSKFKNFFKTIGNFFAATNPAPRKMIPQYQPPVSDKPVKKRARIFGREIISHGNKPTYPPLNAEKKRIRQEKFWMRKYNYSLQGLYLHTDNKLYWESHELAMAHKNG